MIKQRFSREHQQRARYPRVQAVAVAAIVITAAWSFASMLVGRRWLPGPWEAAFEFVRTFSSSAHIHAQGAGQGGVASQALHTAWTFASGLGLGLTAAYLVGLVAATNRWLFYPLAGFALPWRLTPPLILIPLFVAIAGPSIISQVLSIAFYVFVSFLPYVLTALEQVPQAPLDICRVAGASPTWCLLHVRAPWAWPRLRGPAALVSGFSLGVAIVQEYLAAPAGIGRVMKIAMSYTSANLIVVCILWAVLIGFVTDLVIAAAFHPLTRWSSRR